MFSPYSFSHPLSVAPKCSLALRSRHFVGVVLPQCFSPETLPNSRVPEHFLRAMSLGVTHATGLWVTREGHQPWGRRGPPALPHWSSGSVGALPAGLSLPLPIQPNLPDLILGALQVISGASSGPHPHQDACYLEVPSRPAEKTGRKCIARVNRAHSLACASVPTSHSHLLCMASLDLCDSETLHALHVCGLGIFIFIF